MHFEYDSYIYMSDNTIFIFFFFNDTATTEIYTLSLHDALPILESRGFAPLDVTNVVVRAGVTSQQDLTLRVGALTQSIEVTAAAPLVDSAPSNYTTSLQSRYIQDIPLQGRDIQTLVQLIPGVTQSTGPSGSLFGFDSQFGGFPDP